MDGEDAFEPPYPGLTGKRSPLAEGFHTSALDFAYFLDRSFGASATSPTGFGCLNSALEALLSWAFGPSRNPGRRFDDAWHYENDNPLEVWLLPNDDVTTVVTDAAPQWKVEMPTAEIEPAAHDVLGSFANEVAARIPAFTEWETFRPIMARSTAHGCLPGDFGIDGRDIDTFGT
jgi:hypothetical protein